MEYLNEYSFFRSNRGVVKSNEGSTPLYEADCSFNTRDISLAPILFSPTIVANGKLRSAAKTTNHHADHIEKFASELPQNAPNNAVATKPQNFDE